jgi:hypothetical protein
MMSTNNAHTDLAASLPIHCFGSANIASCTTIPAMRATMGRGNQLEQLIGRCTTGVFFLSEIATHLFWRL